MSDLAAHIIRSTRRGLIAGLVIGGIHCVILAGGGLFAMSGPGMIAGSVGRYAALFAILSGLFGLAVGLIVGLLFPWIPARTPLLLPGLVLLYVFPWVAILARERLGFAAGATGMAITGIIIVAVGLTLIIIFSRIFLRRPRDEQELETAPAPLGSLGILIVIVCALASLPTVFGRPVHPVDPALLRGQLLEPLRDRAIATCTNGRWNVLLITVNTLRADHLGCYGYFRETSPAIDWLAENGTRFDHAYCPRPITGPSIASLFTGLYPSQHGVQRPGGILDEEAKTIAERFSESGWSTAGIVTNGSLYPEFGFDQGFNEYIFGHTRAAEGTDHALEWLEANGRNPNAWFLWVHYLDPHMKYEPGPPYDEMFGQGAGTLNRHQRMIDLYDGEIRCTDDQISRIFDWLAQAGLQLQTLVILTADHGESLGEHEVYYRHGLDPYQPSARVPLILYAPAVIPAGRVCPAVVSLVDLLPTVLDAASLPTTSEMAGRSFLPNAVGLTDVGQRDFVVVDAGDIDEPFGYSRALCRTDSKYVQRLTGWALRPGGIRDLLRSYDRCAKGTLGNDEYYDLTIDPRETLNLIRTRQSAARLDRRLLEAFSTEIERGEKPGRVPRVADLTPQARQSLRELGYIR